MGVYEEREIGCGTQFLRILLLIVNFVFILAGIAGVVVGCLVLKDPNTSYLKFCPACKGMSIFTVAIFATLLVFSLIGFIALWKRQNCMLYIYAFFLVIFFLAALTITIVIFMVHDGKFDDDFSKAWNSQVKSDPHGICDFQLNVECSGWDTLCPILPSPAMNLTCANCTYLTPADQTKFNSFNGTCHGVLAGKIDSNYKALIGVGLGLMGTTLISIITTCRVRITYQDYDQLQERF